VKVCIIIPVYNHQEAIQSVVKHLRLLGLPCFLIDDGSSVQCAAVLTQIAETEQQWLTLSVRANNGGKGAAVQDGLRLAINQGYTHAIQIDADGQHQVEDIERFIDASQHYPHRLILGQPVFDDSIPKRRLYGRLLTNVWIRINTLSSAIADGMCGFRCYPLAAVEPLLQSVQLTQRMDFDIEIVVRLYWQGVEVVNIPTKVQYPLDGVSHFQAGLDNLLISKIHGQLFFGMLMRIPQLIIRHC